MKINHGGYQALQCSAKAQATAPTSQDSIELNASMRFGHGYKIQVTEVIMENETNITSDHHVGDVLQVGEETGEQKGERLGCRIRY